MSTGPFFCRTSVIYEASYIPFLFDRETSEDTNKPKGRRTFNKKGVEVVEEVVHFDALSNALLC